MHSGNPQDAYGYAVDPRAIPYGTPIFVPGYWDSINRNNNFVPQMMPKTDDTGGAMRQSWRKGILHIDVRYRTHSAALRWGKRNMKVFVYDVEENPTFKG